MPVRPKTGHLLIGILGVKRIKLKKKKKTMMLF
jgi:hypothetical protein